MKTKKFHLGDVLSITTSRFVSPRYIDGVHDILNFMTGDILFTYQIPRLNDECKPYLIAQFSQLTTAKMKPALTKLNNALRSKTDKAVMEKIVSDWLAKQVAKYGEMFAVKPIPTDAHEVNNPIAEAANMMGGTKKVTVVRI